MITDKNGKLTKVVTNSFSEDCYQDLFLFFLKCYNELFDIYEANNSPPPPPTNLQGSSEENKRTLPRSSAPHNRKNHRPTGRSIPHMHCSMRQVSNWKPLSPQAIPRCLHLQPTQQ
jgi:hypothetical protein